MTNTEETIAAIWSAELNSTSVEPESDFFSLGGDSLNMLTILFRVSQTVDMEVGPEVLYQNPTLRAFSAAIDELRGPSERAALDTGTI